MKNITGMWGMWLSDSAKSTMEYGGYYTDIITPGLRIVSFNTMYCDSDNFWLWLNDTDPTGQLAWLAKVLDSAEQKNEKVYVIGHIPPGSSGCYSAYGQRYYNIINQYNNTVIGQFFGHSHEDYFEVFRDVETNLIPTNLAFICPSITSYIGINPTFRLYQYNTDSFVIENYFQYYADLEAGNVNGSLDFVLMYDAISSYDLPDMSAQSYQNLIEKLAHNSTLLDLFYRRIYTLGPGGQQGCTTEGCMKSTVCMLEAGFADLYDYCMKA